LQLLHCLKNESVGGASTFADGFMAAHRLSTYHPHHYNVRLSRAYQHRSRAQAARRGARQTLRSVLVTFHYRQGGAHHLRFRRRTIEEDGINEYMRINYAPPFQVRRTQGRRCPL
jgi:hypothetical protein